MISNTLPRTVTIVAALAENRAIGMGGKLLYSLPDDMRRFKMLTVGHPVVMGRKTFESLPGGALKNRRNIVVTRQEGYRPEGAETAPSVEYALRMCGPMSEPMVIGGGEIYAQAMKFATRLELTHVLDPGPRGADTFFPAVDPRVWEEVNRTALYKDEKSGVKYVFVSYSRKITNFAPQKPPL